ncbi:MAG: ATP-binding protein [Patescibacteria group bacterium]|nr:ATP-binding protein [Patescibacteria group bacterium]
MIELYLVNKILTLLIVLVGAWLSVWVYYNNKENKVNQIFFLMTFGILIWIIFGYLITLPGQYKNIVILYAKIAYAGVFLWLVSTYYFIIYFPKKKFENKIISFIVVSSVLLLFFITIFTDALVMDANIGEISSNPILGRYWPLIYLIIFVLFIILFVTLFQKYLKISKTEKNKINYIALGLLLFTLINFIFNVFLSPRFGMIPYAYIGNNSAIIFLILTAYAITESNLMGIKTILTQLLIVVMSIILLIDITLLTRDGFMLILKIGVLITFLYFGRGLIVSVEKEKKASRKLQDANEKVRQYVEKLEETNKILEEGNEDLKALLDANDSVIENMDSKKIAQGIVDIIPKSLGHLGNKGGVFVLYNREKKTLNTYAITESKIAQKARKLLGKSLEGHIENIDEVNNFTAQTIKQRKIFVGSKLEDFISPTVSVKICRLIQKLIRAKSFVSVPLYSRGSVVGSLLFVGTKKEKDITQRDKNILFMFSSHIGNAVENARLYEQTNKQIKEMARLNTDLGRANVKLKELLEVKNEFLHITSHQLRTPLTAIRGMISMWYDGDFDDLPKKEKRKMVKRILVSTERLNNITNDMLDALELEGGFLKFQFKSVSIVGIIKEIIETLKPNFDDKKIYIKLENSSNVPHVEVEPNYIRQVFMNIIDNACKYTKKGGVTVSVGVSDKKFIKVIVKDTGVGVNKGDTKKIFEKFTRGKNAVVENASGSGLGLFIARKIIKTHGGKIELESKGRGKGAIVKIYLKINQGE